MVEPQASMSVILLYAIMWFTLAGSMRFIRLFFCTRSDALFLHSLGLVSMAPRKDWVEGVETERAVAWGSTPHIAAAVVGGKPGTLPRVPSRVRPTIWLRCEPPGYEIPAHFAHHNRRKVSDLKPDSTNFGHRLAARKDEHIEVWCNG